MRKYNDLIIRMNKRLIQSEVYISDIVGLENGLVNIITHPTAYRLKGGMYARSEYGVHASAVFLDGNYRAICNVCDHILDMYFYCYASLYTGESRASIQTGDKK